MAGKKKVKRPRSKFGRFFAELTALPGEEPVFEDAKQESKPIDKKPKVNVKELQAAVDSVNAFSAQAGRKAESSKDLLQRDIDAEYAEEFSGAVSNIDKHTENWKKTGETGLYFEPRVTLKERVSKAVDKYKQERSKMQEKKWVDVKEVPFRPKPFLVLKSKVDKFAGRFKKKRCHEPSVKEVFSEVVERADSVRKKSDDEIDNIYKQLNG